MRRAAKVDSTQRQLVKDLRAAGVRVEIIKQPCDLLVRFWCNKHQGLCWQTLECKGPKARPRRDQAYQQAWLAETDTPVVTDFPSAIAALNQHHGVSV